MFARHKLPIRYQPIQRTYQSRLTKKERWRNLRTTVLMSILTASLLGGIVYWGLPVLLKVTSWWTQIQTKPSTISGDTIPPTIPRLLITNKATREQKIEIKGFGEPESTVIIVLNGEASIQSTIESNGQFSAKDIMLNDGVNEISAYAKDKSGNESQVSQIEKITYDNKPPELTITNPQNGSVMRGSQSQTVEITGTVNEESRVWINERLVIVDQGKFSNSFRLTEGPQELILKAIDQAGNESTANLSLTYQP